MRLQLSHLFKIKKKSNENIYTVIELLYAPNGAYLPQLPMKAIPLAESPATASHMIQRNPGKKSYWISVVNVKVLDS